MGRSLITDRSAEPEKSEQRGRREDLLLGGGKTLTWGARASMRLLSAMVTVALLTSLRLADSSACLHASSYYGAVSRTHPLCTPCEYWPKC